MSTDSQSDSPEQPIPGGHRRQTEFRRRRRIRRVVTFIGILALLLTLVIPATGYYVVFVRPLQGTALSVNDSSYTWGEYLTRTRMLIAQAQSTGAWQAESLNSLIFDMIDELERQEIILQYAPLEGVFVTSDEVQREVRGSILGRSGVDDPDITENEFRELYRRRLELLKISEEKFEDVARVEVLRSKLEEVLKQQVPSKVMQRHLFVIQISDLVDAGEALDRIDGGQSFSEVARDISRDTQTVDLGGDLGWIPLGIKDEYDLVFYELGARTVVETIQDPTREISLEDARALRPDIALGETLWLDSEVSVPLFTPTGVSLVMAVGEPELRDVDERHQSTLERGSLDSWLRERREELVTAKAIRRPGGGINTARYQWIINQLQQDRELFPRRSVSG